MLHVANKRDHISGKSFIILLSLNDYYPVTDWTAMVIKICVNPQRRNRVTIMLTCLSSKTSLISSDLRFWYLCVKCEIVADFITISHEKRSKISLSIANKGKRHLHTKTLTSETHLNLVFHSPLRDGLLNKILSYLNVFSVGRNCKMGGVFQTESAAKRPDN